MIIILYYVKIIYITFFGHYLYYVHILDKNIKTYKTLCMKSIILIKELTFFY